MIWCIAVVALLLITAHLVTARTRKFLLLLTEAQSAFAIQDWMNADLLYREALLLVRKKRSKPNHMRHCMVALAQTRYRLGDFTEAELLFQQALPDWEPTAPQVWDDLCFGYATWGQLALDQGRTQEAHAHLQKAMLVRQKCGEQGWWLSVPSPD
jgi:tetratricopeptide (TPR) repeat protein